MTYGEVSTIIDKKRGWINGQIFFNLYITPNNEDEEVPEELMEEIEDYYNLNIRKIGEKI